MESKRAEMARMVRITTDEQATCRREGFSAAVRALRSAPCEANISAARHLEGVAEKRWGKGWGVR
jgi:hypothetical protein